MIARFVGLAQGRDFDDSFVMEFDSDPVGASPEISGKPLQLLKEIVPR